MWQNQSFKRDKKLSTVKINGPGVFEECITWTLKKKVFFIEMVASRK